MENLQRRYLILLIEGFPHFIQIENMSSNLQNFIEISVQLCEPLFAILLGHDTGDM